MERLDTTNVILIVLAAMSVIQTLVLIAVAMVARRAYQAASLALDAKLTPVMLRLEGVLTNLEHTSAVVRTRTDDVSRALDRVQNRAGHVGAVLWPRAAVVVGMAGGVLGVMRRWRASRRRQPDVTVVAG